MICAVQVISIELDTRKSKKQHKKKKGATQKFMLREEMLHCRGQEKISRFM